MIVGFKRRFEPFVLDGSKQHTLRDERKGERQIVAGDRLDLYGDVRQKTQHSLGRYLCTRVQVARFFINEDFYPGESRMSIDGVELSKDEADAFAWRDGFRRVNDPVLDYEDRRGCFSLMIQYWYSEGKELPFEKRLIHWDYSKPVEKDKARKRKVAA